MIGRTVPHAVNAVSGTARVMLRPAAPGTGVKAGGAVRACLEAAGVHDVIAKSLGSRNAINMAYATVEAFRALSAPETIAERRRIASAELVPWLEKARRRKPMLRKLVRSTIGHNKRNRATIRPSACAR